MGTLAPTRMCDPKAKLIPVPKNFTRKGSYSSLCSGEMEEKEPITIPCVLLPLFPSFSPPISCPQPISTTLMQENCQLLGVSGKAGVLQMTSPCFEFLFSICLWQTLLHF